MARSLIEQWLPAQAIGAESLRERGTPKAFPPINFLHVWWARRPLTASRAAVVASLLPAWPTAEEASDDTHSAQVLAGLRREFPHGEAQYHAWFIRALGILGDPIAGRAAIKAALAQGRTTGGNAYGYPRAFTVSPDGETIDLVQRLAALRGTPECPPFVVDPFAGGGSIPFEAARFGCDTLANELNPVAAAILEGTLSLPAQLGPKFAKVIEQWGAKWSERVRERLEDYFPLQSHDERLAYIWAHTVPCPTTGRPTPLAPDFWLARGDAGKVAIRLEVDAALGTIESVIVTGEAATEFGNRATYKNGAAESVWTGETFSGSYIQAQAQHGGLGVMLLAVSVTRARITGRRFRAPTEKDREAIEASKAELARRLPKWEIEDLVPTESIDSVSNYDRGHRMYGIERWSEMFMPRQLLSNVTILEELRKLVNEARRELPLDEVKALALYLAFALDKMVDYNSRQCSWHSSRALIRNTFDKHNFNFKWSFAEFDAAHALVPWAVGNAVANHTKICSLIAQDETIFSAVRSVTAHVSRGSAANLNLPDESVDVIVTDPPYYDNVMYAECSDFFYVWLKRSLRETWPQYTDLVLTDKEDEAVANRALFKDIAAPAQRGHRRSDGGKTAAELADERYEQLLTEAFREAHRVLKPCGVLTVMFTHKRVDAWDTLGAALLDAGFSIDASWPVHTESEKSLHQAKKNAASSTIFLACRKRASSSPAYWADIRSQVESAAEQAASRFSAEGLTGVDLTLASYGPVLSVLSDSWPVYTGELGADGHPEVLRPDAALDLARERVATLKKRGLLGGREVEFDRITDWYLLAWNDFQAAEFPFDEARKLCIATHLEIDEIAREHKIIKATSGKVTLQTPAQRRTAGGLDTNAASYPTWIDRLHALMLVYDEDGLAAARAWLARTGLGDDGRFGDLVEAAMHAIPRVKDKGQFARPEARIIDSLRTALFDHIPPPVEPSATAVQGAFEIAGELGFKLPGELGYEDDGEGEVGEGEE